MKISLLIFATLAFISCKNSVAPKAVQETEKEAFEECACPPTIYLQPLNNYSQSNAKQIKKQISNSNIELFDGVDIEILPNLKLDDTTLNQTSERYRSDKILNVYKSKANKHYVIIGLINEDISTSYKGKKDWGVLGLSYKGKYVSVVSTYRLKNAKRDFWKVVVHEFIHSYFGYGHCPKDNDNCIMQDAKGHANFAKKNNLCNYCKAHL